MREPVSYICERTAEYTIVPELVRHLKSKHSYVTPIYPWMTRELSRFSRELPGAGGFKILGLYARRPKIRAGLDNSIYIKINREIVIASKVARDFGIPMIAGCPLARNLIELGCCDRFLWVDLHSVYPSDADSLVVVDNFSWDKTSEEAFLNSDLAQVMQDAESVMREVNLNILAEAIKAIGLAVQGIDYHPYYFKVGYKPVYFLIADF
ncbi:hypothetical protein [Pseudomonas mangiferae]|uniref:Uncharacterized protein n=1 Tax=Pseudomonas mangiferae TaxID=2593654 RepID=A0A553H023_9PSED|nr:hypothetical protein [Pseudomonas mangiferae]TRX75098.1 hypothetical protein FM069_08320 [Pseudomonas mangiferae]